MKQFDFERHRQECLQMRSEYVFDAFGASILRGPMRSRARSALAVLVGIVVSFVTLTLISIVHDAPVGSRAEYPHSITALASGI